MRGKRAFDLFVSSILLVLASPIMVGSAVWIRVTSAGPVWHRATRVGRDGELFTMFKFRSMVLDAAEAPGSPTTGLNDPRLTPVGRRLRKYKLDELPQLFNIIRGDMSLVGPRPEVPECVDLYTPHQREILRVRPGMTDLASIEFVDLQDIVGESDDPHQVYLEQVFDRKNELRLQYVENLSWRQDFEILCRTILSVVRSRS